MAEKRYNEAQLIQELVKKTTFNTHNTNTNTNNKIWSKLSLMSDFVQSSARKWKKVDEALLVITEHIEEYLLTLEFESASESEQKQCWVKLKHRIMDKAGEFADVQSLILIKVMEELIARGSLELFNSFLEDDDLQTDIIKGYRNGSKNWLLLALNSNQLQMFDYLAENTILKMDLHSISIFSTSLGGSHAPAHHEIIPLSELMAIILAKNPVFVAYLINYDKKHQRGLQATILKELKEFYPQCLSDLVKIELYETLESELISPKIQINDKNETAISSSETLDVFKI